MIIAIMVIIINIIIYAMHAGHSSLFLIMTYSHYDTKILWGHQNIPSRKEPFIKSVRDTLKVWKQVLLTNGIRL